MGVVKSQSVFLDDTYSYQTSCNSKSYLWSSAYTLSWVICIFLKTQYMRVCHETNVIHLTYKRHLYIQPTFSPDWSWFLEMQQACHLIAGAHYVECTQKKLGDDAYVCIQTDSNNAMSKTVHKCNISVNANTPRRKMKRQHIRMIRKNWRFLCIILLLNRGWHEKQTISYECLWLLGKIKPAPKNTLITWTIF
jgi:hypothetical protein